MADSDLPHQIVIIMAAPNSHLITISCNCLRTSHRLNKATGHEAIAVRDRWNAADALDVYRKWHEEQGIPLGELTG